MGLTSGAKTELSQSPDRLAVPGVAEWWPTVGVDMERMSVAGEPSMTMPAHAHTQELPVRVTRFALHHGSAAPTTVGKVARERIKPPLIPLAGPLSVSG